jgi:hypothetical protein
MEGYQSAHVPRPMLMWREKLKAVLRALSQKKLLECKYSAHIITRVKWDKTLHQVHHTAVHQEGVAPLVNIASMHSLHDTSNNNEENKTS